MLSFIGAKPWGHQVAGIERALERNDFAFFFEAGTGKTFTVINVLRNIFEKEKRTLRTLILCPLVVVDNWKEEFGRYSELYDHCLVPKGTGKKRNEVFLKYKDYHPILITNYESLQSKDFANNIAIWRPEVVVMDESHRLKNPQGKRSQKVMALCDNARYRYQATGTPILNTELDLFQQFRCLDKGETFGTNFFAFRAKYFEDANESWAHRHNHFPCFVARKGTDQELRQKISLLSMRVEKEKCLDLPPFVKQRAYVEMDKSQEKTYDDMRDNFIAFLKDNEDAEEKAVVARMALTKALRLQQIVSGFAKLDDGSVKAFDKNPRLAALREYLGDLTPHHKVIVWAVFKENYAQIRRECRDLGIKFAELHGGVSNKQTEINLFTGDKDYRVMIAHPGSGGIGVNLIEASYSIYFSRGFSLEHDIQSEARNYRGGSEVHKKITRIDLVCPNTIDDLVLDSLQNKQSISDRILDIGREL